MNEWDAWVYLDGPEPALVRELAALVRAPSPPPASEEEVEAFSQRVIDRVARSRRGESVLEPLWVEGLDDVAEEDEEEAPDAGAAETVAAGTGAAPGTGAAAGSGAAAAVPEAVVNAPGVQEAATGAGVKATGAGVLPTTSLSLDVLGAMRARREAPVVQVVEAPTVDPRTVRVPVAMGSDAGQRAEVGGSAGSGGLGKKVSINDERLASIVAAYTQAAAREATAAPGGAAETQTEGGLTLEQYASLLVDLQRYERSWVLMTYRVGGEEGLARLNAAWEARMTRAPEIRGELARAVEVYREHVRGLVGR